MYEPIIDPMIFYWINVVSSLSDIFFLTLSVCALSFFFSFLFYIDCDANTVRKWQKYLVIGAIISGILTVFIPSKEVCYQMLIAQQVTPHNIEVAGETIDKSLDNVFNKIIKVTEEVQK